MVRVSETRDRSMVGNRWQARSRWQASSAQVLQPVVLIILLALVGTVLMIGFQHASWVSLQQRLPNDATGKRIPGTLLARILPANTAHDSGETASSNALASLGRDALRIWGEWDGLSPVMTQMMAQESPRAATISTAAQHRSRRGKDRRKRGKPLKDETASGAWRTIPSDREWRGRILHRKYTAGFLRHIEREVAPFPYVLAVFSLHGMHYNLGGAEAIKFKEAIQSVLGLRVYVSDAMRSVLGNNPWDWIEIQDQRTLNCSATPHVCDDRGRRRRRLLSVEGLWEKHTHPRRRGGRGIWESPEQDESKLAKTSVDAEKARAAWNKGDALEHKLREAVHDHESHDNKMIELDSSGNPPWRSMTVDDKPEEWKDFDVIRVETRIFVQKNEDLCIVGQKLTHVVKDSDLKDELEHLGLDGFDIGLLQEARGYDENHECACNCQNECGALTLFPCPPEIEVGGEYVGPSYKRSHLHAVSFFFKAPGDQTRKQLEKGIAKVAYTTDGSTPDCTHGILYEWGTAVTFYRTTSVTAGICADGKFSVNLKHATLVVVTPRLRFRYPIYWLSYDRRCIRIDGPLSAYHPAKNTMVIVSADGLTEFGHRYDFIEHQIADAEGPEGVLSCSKVPYPRKSLYGWALSNVVADRQTEADNEIQDEKGEKKAGVKDSVKGLENSSSSSSDNVVENVDSRPWQAWSTWSAHPIPGIAVDRNWIDGLRPGRQTNHGNPVFGGGEYERENGMFNQWKIVYRRHDGSAIRILAPLGAFKSVDSSSYGKGWSSPSLSVKIEWPDGKLKTYFYTTAKNVEQDQDGPKGIELIAPAGEFPRSVMWGWARQNIPAPRVDPGDFDNTAPLEKAGVNIRAGFMTGEAGDRQVATTTFSHNAARQTIGPSDANRRSGSSLASSQDSNKTAPEKSQDGSKSIDLIIERAAESALKADKARKRAEAVASELKSKVAELTKKLQAVQGGKERKTTQTETEENESWFKRVEDRSSKERNRKWAAIREEERMASAEQIKYSEDRPRRIPIGANEPQTKKAYTIALPAGQEAYSEEHSSVKAIGSQFPVLSVSRDGTQIRIAAPNDGTFAVGPAKLEIETADGGQALFPYEQVSTVADFAEHSNIRNSGLLFTAPPGGVYPLNSAYVMAVADPAHFPIVWRHRHGTSIKVLAPNDGTFSPGPGAVLIKRVGGEEETYHYKSIRFEKASVLTGPAGLLITAANGTFFPKYGSFVGASDLSKLHRMDAFKILWRSSDGSEVKVEAANDGSFNLGPSRFLLRLKNGGIADFPYDTVSLSPVDERGAAGLLFKAPPEIVYPAGVISASPLDFSEPYPIFGRSSDGKTIYVQAPNDGTFARGPSNLRLRLSNAQAFMFPYSFVAWHASKGGLPAGLSFTAPKGVHYPDNVAYAGPIDGLKPHDSFEPHVHNEHWPEKSNVDRSSCNPKSPPVEIKVIEAMSDNEYSVARLCENEAAYTDTPELVFHEVPDALIGQTFIRGADSDVTATSLSFLVMQLSAPSLLFLLWDERGLPRRDGKLPTWVDAAFIDTGAVVWVSGVCMGVLRSRMPVSGPVYMGGAHAFPSSGAIHNYIAVVTKVNANLVKSRDDTAWQGSVGTWTKRPFPMGALDMHVILYNKDRQSLIVRTSVNPFPSGRGYFRITQVDFEPGEGPENQAEVGQLVAYREVTTIEPGFTGYPGIEITALQSNIFPPGIRKVEPTIYKIISRRDDGLQIEVDAPQDGWFSEGPATLNLLLEDGSEASMVYESVGAISTTGWGGLIFTTLQGEIFPRSAAWATPGGPAAGPAEPGKTNPSLSNFPRKDVTAQNMFPVSWMSKSRDEIRVACPEDVFEPGPAKLMVRIQNKLGVLQEGKTIIEYSRAATVVSDENGPSGMIIRASREQLFPEGAAMVSPTTFHVVAVSQDRKQIQALSTLASFPPGPASLRLVHADGTASSFPYVSVVQLPADHGVLFTAPGGFYYSKDADYVSKDVVQKEAIVQEDSVGDAEHIPVASSNSGDTSYMPWSADHALIVEDARSTTGRKVSVSVAVPGASLYSDRLSTLKRVPSALYGMPLVSLADGDGESKVADLLQLRANRPCYVYVLRDPRGTPVQGGKIPLWISTSFIETPLIVYTSMSTMPSLTVYRSKVPLWGPIRLGGNAAFPSQGAKENFAVILQAARDASMDTLLQSSASKSADSVPDSQPGGKESDDANGLQQEDLLSSTNEVAVSEDSLENIVRQCESEAAAKACLQHMHACIAPYKMGDLNSCHCFITSRRWCTDRCSDHRRSAPELRQQLAAFNSMISGFEKVHCAVKDMVSEGSVEMKVSEAVRGIPSLEMAKEYQKHVLSLRSRQMTMTFSGAIHVRVRLRFLCSVILNWRLYMMQKLQVLTIIRTVIERQNASIKRRAFQNLAHHKHYQREISAAGLHEVERSARHRMIMMQMGVRWTQTSIKNTIACIRRNRTVSRDYRKLKVQLQRTNLEIIVQCRAGGCSHAHRRSGPNFCVLAKRG